MKKLFLLLLITVSTTFVFAQDLYLVSGNLDFLKNETEVNVLFNMDNVRYQVENFTEQEYLERRKTETLSKKNAETWEKWMDEWQKFKDSEYLSFFLKGLNEKSKKTAFKENIDSKYTLIIDSEWIYAGWYGGIMYQEGKLTSKLKFVKTANPNHVLAVVTGDKVLGKKKNEFYAMEYGRIAAAYENTGRELAKEIKFNLK